MSTTTPETIEVDVEARALAEWLGLSASVIKSGEPWTATCEGVHARAKAALSHLLDRLSKAEGELRRMADVDLSVPPFGEGGIGSLLMRAEEQYAAEYVLSTEGDDHEPTEFERELLTDYWNGLISDERFFGIIRGIAARAEASEASRLKAEGERDEVIGRSHSHFVRKAKEDAKTQWVRAEAAELRASKAEERARDAEHRAELAEAAAAAIAEQRDTALEQRKALVEALGELAALVRGECPRLLNEDSGGDAELSLRIDAALSETAEALPKDVTRLVIAARRVAYESQERADLRELDEAAEAFASRVPWENEPALPAPPTTKGEG